MKTTEQPVIVQQLFNTSEETVWAAITELPQMKKWFFENIPDFQTEIGFSTRFVIRNGDRVFPHLWTITEVIPLKKISYEWKYEGYSGDSLVTFELIGQKEKTRLILTHRVLESFPDDIPEFSRKSCIGGWEYFINLRLKEYLEKIL